MDGALHPPPNRVTEQQSVVGRIAVVPPLSMSPVHTAGGGRLLGVTKGGGASPCPADALDAVAEDTPRAVLAGEVRGGGTGDIGSVEGAVRRTTGGVDRLGSGSPDPSKLEHHRSRNASRGSRGRLADQRIGDTSVCPPIFEPRSAVSS